LPDSEEGYLKPGAVVVAVDPDYFRPTEVASLLGDSGKARAKLGWEAKIGFGEMVREMVTEDLKLAQRDELCKRGGFKIYEYNE
jgi:GDPmannose 4,6-dehydratase